MNIFINICMRMKRTLPPTPPLPPAVPVPAPAAPLELSEGRITSFEVTFVLLPREREEEEEAPPDIGNSDSSRRQYAREFASPSTTSSLLSMQDALSRLSDSNASGSFSVGIESTPRGIRDTVRLLESITNKGKMTVNGVETYRYVATYKFPSVQSGRSGPEAAQLIVDQMFEKAINYDESVVMVPLKSISLKKIKSHVNHRAELYIWIGSHESIDYPRHQPIWLNRENKVEEGSSTYCSLVHNFPPDRYPDLEIPCIYKLQSGHVLSAVDTERQLIQCAWRGVLEDVQWAISDLKAVGNVAFGEYSGHTALSKAHSLGYSDILSTIEKSQASLATKRLSKVVVASFFKVVFGMLMFVYSINKCTVPVVAQRYNSSPDYLSRLPLFIIDLFKDFPWYFFSSSFSSTHYWDCHPTFMVIASLGMILSSNNISRISCAVYGLLTILLLSTDISKYNNHEYLYGSLAILLSCLDCHKPEFSMSRDLTTSSRCSTTESSPPSQYAIFRTIKSLRVVSFAAVIYLSMCNIVYGIAGYRAMVAVPIMWMSVAAHMGCNLRLIIPASDNNNHNNNNNDKDKYKYADNDEAISSSNTITNTITGGNSDNNNCSSNSSSTNNSNLSSKGAAPPSSSKLTKASRILEQPLDSISCYQIIILKAFLGGVYLYAGIAKTSTDWLSGATMNEILMKMTLDPEAYNKFLAYLGTIWPDILTNRLDLIILSWSGLFLDLLFPIITAIPINSAKSYTMYIRLLALFSMAAFHISNHFLFVIETFPWVMLTSMAVYMNFDDNEDEEGLFPLYRGREYIIASSSSNANSNGGSYNYSSSINGLIYNNCSNSSDSDRYSQVVPKVTPVMFTQGDDRSSSSSNCGDLYRDSSSRAKFKFDETVLIFDVTKLECSSSLLARMYRLSILIEAVVASLYNLTISGLFRKVKGLCSISLRWLVVGLLLVTQLVIPLHCALPAMLDQGNLSWISTCQFGMWRMMTRSVSIKASNILLYNPISNKKEIFDIRELTKVIYSSSDSSTSAEDAGNYIGNYKSFVNRKDMQLSYFEDQLWNFIQDVRSRAIPVDSTKASTSSPVGDGGDDNNDNDESGQKSETFIPPVIKADIWLEINGPPIQRYIDPSVDLAKATLRDYQHSRKILSSSLGSTGHGRSCGFSKPCPLASWVQPRLQQYRSLRWIRSFDSLRAAPVFFQYDNPAVKSYRAANFIKTFIADSFNSNINNNINSNSNIDNHNRGDSSGDGLNEVQEFNLLYFPLYSKVAVLDGCVQLHGIGSLCRGECVEVIGHVAWRVGDSNSNSNSNSNINPDSSGATAQAACEEGSDLKACQTKDYINSRHSSLFFIIAGVHPSNQAGSSSSSGADINPSPAVLETFTISHAYYFDATPVPYYKSPVYSCGDEIKT